MSGNILTSVADLYSSIFFLIIPILLILLSCLANKVNIYGATKKQRFKWRIVFLCWKKFNIFIKNEIWQFMFMIEFAKICLRHFWRQWKTTEFNRLLWKLLKLLKKKKIWYFYYILYFNKYKAYHYVFGIDLEKFKRHIYSASHSFHIIIWFNVYRWQNYIFY